MIRSGRSSGRFGLVLCLLGIALTTPARADTFGDIDIIKESEPRGDSWHGYFEYAFVVTNRSSELAHTGKALGRIDRQRL